MEIKFLDVGCGDGIYIRFLGSDDRFHNIIIDGGTEKGDIYFKTLRKEINEIKERNEIIDLWVITHIDDDHIGGLLRLIKDEPLIIEIDLSKTMFWFNYSNWDYDTGIKKTNLKSVRQGIRLRDHLKSNSHVTEFITDDMEKVDFFGLKILILSPNLEAFSELISTWEKEEVKIITRKAALHKTSRANDYNIKVEEFDLSTNETDKSVENQSSIAMLIEFKNKRIMLSSDSNPSVLINSLKKLGYTEEDKLSVEYMQVPHHGSKFNTSDQLLKLINCANYIVSADGFNKDNLPNKKTLARIIKQNFGKLVNLYFTQKNDLTNSIFEVDKEIKNIAVHFPTPGSNGLLFNL